ncbi:MAG TPA: hypothetical protein VGH48_11710, partial [Caldimonas sp.]
HTMSIRTLVAAAACSAAALSACVVAPVAQPYGYGPGPDVITDVAPPAPYYEPVPVLPYPGAVWIGGYWGWSGGHHAWVAGHYDHGRPGYTWQAHRWERANDGRWHLHEGHWARS